MRILEREGVAYSVHLYEGGALSGTEVARVLGEQPERVFKTLVASAGAGRCYVFVIPVAAELDLKKAARAAGEKSVEMLPQRQLLPATGYVHGGCSPVGMKKKGVQVELASSDLLRVTGGAFADLIRQA